MYDSICILFEYNVGCDFEWLICKFDVIVVDLFLFFCGINNLYVVLLVDVVLLYDVFCMFVCGDLYFENFGSFKGDNGFVYFDMNDFDEVLVVLFIVDLVCVLFSLQVVFFSWKLVDEDVYNLCWCFFDMYVVVLVDGKLCWVECVIVMGIVCNLLCGLCKCNWVVYLVDCIECNGNWVILCIDGWCILWVSKEEVCCVCCIFEVYGQQGNGQCFIVIDVVWWIVGIGSLGFECYFVFVCFENDFFMLCLIDIKFFILSVWDDVLGDVCSVVLWCSQVGCVVDIQCLLQVILFVLLCGVVYGVKGEKLKLYVVKSLQLIVDCVVLGLGKNVVVNLDDVLQIMVCVVVWCYLCGCG